MVGIKLAGTFIQVKLGLLVDSKFTSSYSQHLARQLVEVIIAFFVSVPSLDRSALTSLLTIRQFHLAPLHYISLNQPQFKSTQAIVHRKRKLGGYF